MGSVSWQGVMLPRLQPGAPAPAPAEQHQPLAALAHTGCQHRGAILAKCSHQAPTASVLQRGVRWPFPCIAWIRACTAGTQRCGAAGTQAPHSSPGTARALLTHGHAGLGGGGGSAMPRSARWSWVGRPVLGASFWAEMCPFPAGDELASVAAALLDDHVLVVADDNFALLVVEHGEGTHPDRGAGGAGHLVGLVELQQTLWGDTGRAKHHPLLWPAGLGVHGGEWQQQPPLTCM